LGIKPVGGTLKMDPYIYTSRNGVHIIDLVQTAQMTSSLYMRSAAEQGKKFSLLVQTASSWDYKVGSRPLWCLLHQPTLVRRNAPVDDDQTRVDRLKLERRDESGALDVCRKSSFYAGDDETPGNTWAIKQCGKCLM